MQKFFPMPNTSKISVAWKQTLYYTCSKKNNSTTVPLLKKTSDMSTSHQNPLKKAIPPLLHLHLDSMSPQPELNALKIWCLFSLDIKTYFKCNRKDFHYGKSHQLKKERLGQKTNLPVSQQLSWIFLHIFLLAKRSSSLAFLKHSLFILWHEHAGSTEEPKGMKHTLMHHSFTQFYWMNTAIATHSSPVQTLRWQLQEVLCMFFV